MEIVGSSLDLMSVSTVEWSVGSQRGNTFSHAVMFGEKKTNEVEQRELM